VHDLRSEVVSGLPIGFAGCKEDESAEIASSSVILVMQQAGNA
jgi:predicted transporter